EPDELHAVGRWPGLVELDVAEPPALEGLERDAGPEVAPLGERDRVARLQLREDEGRRCPRAGGKEDGVAAVELAEPGLGLGPRRVAVALVEERPRLPALVVRPDGRAIDVAHPRDCTNPTMGR